MTTPLKILECRVVDFGLQRYPDYELHGTCLKAGRHWTDALFAMDIRYTEDYDPESLASAIWRMFDDTNKPVALYLTFYDSRVEEDTYEEFFLSTADGELGENTATEEDLVLAFKNYERFKIMYLWAGERT